MPTIDRPEELVSVPRWVLDTLLPMSLGAFDLISKARAVGIPSVYITEAGMTEAEEALVIAFEALHGKEK